MTGIPSTESAGKALSGATRVLLRIAVLVGLVVCGWLLGTGTGAADETEPDDGSTPAWVQVAFDHDEHSGPAPVAGTPRSPGTATPDTATPDTATPDTATTDTAASADTPDFSSPRSTATPEFTATPESAGTPAGTPGSAAAAEAGNVLSGLLTPLAGGGEAVVPVGEVLRLPARLPGPDLAGQVVEPLGPVLESVLQPVTAPVLGTTAQQSDRPAAAQTAPSAVRPVASPAAPVPAPRTPVPAAPLQAPAVVAPATLSASTQLAADQLATASAAGDERATSSTVPAGPHATAPLPCPPGPAGANTVVPGGHAATPADGLADAAPGLVQLRLSTGAGGLPRCPGQQPSTSPD